MTRHTSMTRRQLLRSAGALALSAPLAGSLLSKALADPGAVLGGKRLVAIHLPYGGCREHWFPDDALMADAPRVSARAVAKRIADLPADVSPVLSRSIWGDTLDRMVILDGIDGAPSTGHSRWYGLTNCAVEEPALLPTPSLDQLVAYRSPIYTSEPAFRTLNVANGEDGQALSYAEGGVAIPEISDPAVVWDSVFSRVASSPEALAELERTRSVQRSVLDHAAARHGRLAAHAAMGTEDRRRLDAYVTYLREYERALSASASMLCTTPDRPDATAYPEGPAKYEASALDHVRNIAHAIRCDLTRVVTFNVEPSSRTYWHLEGVTDHHHSLTHAKESIGERGDGARTGLLSIDRAHAAIVAELVRSLDVVADPTTGRTFLDDTIVIVTNEMGTVRNHCGMRLPILLFGGRGVIREGTIVDYRSPYSTTVDGTEISERLGVAYSNVLITVARLLGLEPADWEHGEPGFGIDGARTGWAERFGGGVEAYYAHAFGDRRSALSEVLVPAS